MTSLWRNFSINVVANSNWSCLLISVPKVHWTVQPTAADSRCIARVSQQCLQENRPQMLEKERWPLNNSPNLNGMEIYRVIVSGSDERSYIWKLNLKPKQFLNQKSRWRRYGTIPQVELPVIKVSQVFPFPSLPPLHSLLRSPSPSSFSPSYIAT